MVCIKLKQLTQCLDRNGLRPSKSDVISIVCGACKQAEVCPALPTSIDEVIGKSDPRKARIRVSRQVNGQTERLGQSAL